MRVRSTEPTHTVVHEPLAELARTWKGLLRVVGWVRWPQQAIVRATVQRLFANGIAKLPLAVTLGVCEEGLLVLEAGTSAIADTNSSKQKAGKSAGQSGAEYGSRRPAPSAWTRQTLRAHTACIKCTTATSRVPFWSAARGNPSLLSCNLF